MDLPKLWLHIGNTHLFKEQFKPIRNQIGLMKPIGGIWASPFIFGDKYYSDWERFSESVWENDEKKEGTLITLRKNARIYTIDTKEDIIRLIDEIGEIENPLSSVFPLLFSKQIDFEKMSSRYDAIYLTKSGLMNTKRNFSQEQFNLYGWDCECCLILNYDIILRQTGIVLEKPSKRIYDKKTTEILDFTIS